MKMKLVEVDGNVVQVPNHILFILISCSLILSSYCLGLRPGPRAQSGGKGPVQAWPAIALGPRLGSQAPKCKHNIKVLCHIYIYIYIYIYFYMSKGPAARNRHRAIWDPAPRGTRKHFLASVQ